MSARGWVLVVAGVPIYLALACVIVVVVNVPPGTHEAFDLEGSAG